MQKIKINEDFIYYKSPKFIPAGEYYILDGIRPDDITKKSYGLIASQYKDGSFHWLAPGELWVEKIERKIDSPSPGKTALEDILATFEIDESLFHSLRQWQQKTLFRILEKSNRKLGIIAPLGAGKTLLGLIVANGSENSVVIAPRNVHETWLSEAEKWNLRVPRISTYESSRKIKKAEILILDEVLQVKNPEAQRTSEIRRLSRESLCTLGFTGTPQGAKEALDLRWFNAVEPKKPLPDKDFNFKYLFGINPHTEKIKGIDKDHLVVDDWNRERITEFLKPYSQIVELSEISSDLPEISYKKIMLSRPKSWLKIFAGLSGAGTENKKFSQLRQITDGFYYKEDHTPVHESAEKITWIKEFISNYQSESIVIYSNWTASVKKLAEELKEYSPAVLTGDTVDMTAEITRFKGHETSILIANTRISQGMNLQETARIMIFMSNSLNPIDRVQAIGRIYRPGQKKPVVIYDLICEKTLDLKQLEIIEKYKSLSEKQVEALLEKELKNI